MAQLIDTTVNGSLKVSGNVELGGESAKDNIIMKINNIDYSMTSEEYNELLTLIGGDSAE